jgi:hypothetical protein
MLWKAMQPLRPTTRAVLVAITASCLADQKARLRLSYSAIYTARASQHGGLHDSFRKFGRHVFERVDPRSTLFILQSHIKAARKNSCTPIS